MEKSKSAKSNFFRILRWVLMLAFIVSTIMSLPFLYLAWSQMSNYWSAWTLIPRTYPNSVILLDGQDGVSGNCCKVETWIYCTLASIAEVKIFYETYVGNFHDRSELNENGGERYFATISSESPRLNHSPPASAKPPMLIIDIYNGHPDCPDGTIYEFTIVYYSE